MTNNDNSFIKERYAMWNRQPTLRELLDNGYKIITFRAEEDLQKIERTGKFDVKKAFNDETLSLTLPIYFGTPGYLFAFCYKGELDRVGYFNMKYCCHIKPEKFVLLDEVRYEDLNYKIINRDYKEEWNDLPKEESDKKLVSIIKDYIESEPFPKCNLYEMVIPELTGDIIEDITLDGESIISNFNFTKKDIEKEFVTDWYEIDLVNGHYYLYRGIEYLGELKELSFDEGFDLYKSTKNTGKVSDHKDLDKCISLAREYKDTTGMKRIEF